MEVRIVSYTGMPQKTIATAGKLCYSSSDIDNLEKGLNPEKIDGFIKMLSELGHESPIEHASFTFAIEGISRVTSHQIVRHRLSSYSQKSQRYVMENDFEFIIPKEIDKDPKTKVHYMKAMRTAKRMYNTLFNKLKTRYVEEGIDEKDAEKKAMEDARYVLPNSTETKMIVTMNARSLNNFFQQRCCNRAQWEIRELADEMLKLVKDIAPTLFINSGASCMNGQCPEGSMSCGIPRKIEEYQE